LNRKKKEIQEGRASDQELLDLLERDPQAGMEVAVGQFTGLLWRVVERYLQDPEDIKECVNDAFLEFYMHRDRFDVEKGALSAYLAQIARNLAVSRYRKNAARRDLPLGDAEAAASGQELAEARIDLERAMAALKPEDAEIIRMKYYGGMTVREIASSLGLSCDAVKKRHQRSLSKLKILLLGILLLALLALLFACAYKLLRYFGIIPGYGINNDPKAQVFILEDPVQVESGGGTCFIRDAMLLNNKLYILMDYRTEDQPLTEADMDQLISEDAGPVPVSLNGASFGVFSVSSARAWNDSGNPASGQYLAVQLTIQSLDLEDVPRWEDGIDAAFTFKGTDLACRLVRIEPGRVSDYSYQLGSRGGLLAIPRMEEGRLIVGVYPLNTGTETLLTALLRGRIMEGKVGDVTATAPDGRELVGECVFGPMSNSEYFYDWDFGPAQPGDYTLHIPYVFLSAPVEEPAAFSLDLQRCEWDETPVPVPGGTLSVESCQPVELPVGAPIPGKAGPFTVQEDSRIWTLRLRYDPLEDLAMTSCLLAPAEGMEIQEKTLYGIAVDGNGNSIPFNVAGFSTGITVYGEEDNVVELTLLGWDGCFDPANVLLTVSEPLSLRWEHSFDLPLVVEPEEATE